MNNNLNNKKLKLTFGFLVLLFLNNCSEETEINSIEEFDSENKIFQSYQLNEEEKSSVHPIILPGAPGEKSRRIDPEAATNIATTTYLSLIHI